VNRYGSALEHAEGAPDYLNLIDTNFHSAGLSYDEASLARWSSEYFETPTLRRYAPEPAGSSDLRSAIAGWYREREVAVKPADVVVTASASESYSHIFAGLLESNAEVLLPCPGYPLFEEVARRCGLVPRFYQLDPEDGWQPDVARVAGRIERATAAVVLISPNNPTGHVLSAEKIAEIEKLCLEHDLLLIVDEVFSEYRHGADPAPLPRPAALSREVRTCTINGASKLFASPDLKVSWIALTGPDWWRTEALESLEIENDLYLNGSPLSQHLVRRMLEAGSAETDRIVREVAARRSVLLEALRGLERVLPGAISYEEPEAGIHMPIRIERSALSGGADDEALVVSALTEFHLNLHPGYLYGIEDETIVIVSFLPPEATLREGVARLEKLLARHMS
jgi:hypothetical protein